MSQSIPQTGQAGLCYARFASLFLSKAFAIIFFSLFIVSFSANAQQAAHPSCNISGPLEAIASGPDIVINVEVAHSTSNPKLTYEFASNTSGAVIKNQGPVKFNAATNSVTQQLTINPGAHGSGFNLKLTVTTPGGVSTCSKSVSVSQ